MHIKFLITFFGPTLNLMQQRKQFLENQVYWKRCVDASNHRQTKDRWYCEGQRLIFCCQQILWKWIEKRFKFFWQLVSVNWTSWISTQLIKYLRKSFDPIIWSSNLRTTTEASNTPNVYSSGAVIPQYTSSQFMNVFFHKTHILMPVFQSESQFSLTSVPSACNPIQCLLLAVIRAQIFSNMQNITVQ